MWLAPSVIRTRPATRPRRGQERGSVPQAGHDLLDRWVSLASQELHPRGRVNELHTSPDVRVRRSSADSPFHPPGPAHKLVARMLVLVALAGPNGAGKTTFYHAQHAASGSRPDRAASSVAHGHTQIHRPTLAPQDSGALQRGRSSPGPGPGAGMRPDELCGRWSCTSVGQPV
jgi:hypothetical protein